MTLSRAGFEAPHWGICVHLPGALTIRPPDRDNVHLMSTSESSVPPPMYTATPIDSSIVYQFPWNQEQVALIQEHQQYHYQMTCFIEDLTKGSAAGKEMPKNASKRSHTSSG